MLTKNETSKNEIPTVHDLIRELFPKEASRLLTLVSMIDIALSKAHRIAFKGLSGNRVPAALPITEWNHRATPKDMANFNEELDDLAAMFQHYFIEMVPNLLSEELETKDLIIVQDALRVYLEGRYHLKSA